MSYQLKPGFLSNVLGQPGLSKRSYSAKVRNIALPNLIGYWQLGEKTGTNAVNTEGTAARDGTYTGVGLNSSTGPDGQPVGLWDGANDFCNIYSASLNTAFNGAEGTLAAWVKVSGAGVWTDGAQRFVIRLYVDGNNSIEIFKSTINGRFDFVYWAGAVRLNVAKTSYSNTDWFHLAITWSKVADEARFFIDGIQFGATINGLGVWAGVLASNNVNIGASSTGPGSVWDGYLAHSAIWTTPLTPAQIASLAVV